MHSNIGAEATYSYDQPAYETVNVEPIGQPVASIDVFFDQLDPYGTWYDDPSYGWVFTPSQASYVPYSNGYWKYTDYGLLWVSNDQFGWATDHYGRWVYQTRWVWKPDLAWGPSWVSWREGDGWIGWAPLGYGSDAYVPENHWRFVGVTHLFALDINARYVREPRRYLAASTPIVRYRRHNQDEWVAGPSETWLRKNRLGVTRAQVKANEVGRLDAQRHTELERRARARQSEWDQRRARELQVRADLDERQRKQRDEQRRRVNDAQGRADQQRSQRADQRRQQDDQKRAADQQRKQQDEQKRAADQQRKQQDEQRRHQDEQKRAADQQRKQQDEQRRHQDDQKRAADQQRKQQDEQKRKQQDDQKRKQQDDQKRAEPQRKQQDEQKRKQDVEQKRKQDDEQKRKQQDKQPHRP